MHTDMPLILAPWVPRSTHQLRGRERWTAGRRLGAKRRWVMVKGRWHGAKVGLGGFGQHGPSSGACRLSVQALFEFVLRVCMFADSRLRASVSAWYERTLG